MAGSLPEAPQKVRAVFFDAGLTLIRSDITLAECCSRIAREHGFQVDAADIQAALPKAVSLMLHTHREDPHIWSTDAGVGRLWREHYVAILRAAGITGDIDACVDAIYSYYNRRGTWTLFPDVLPTMETLHARGYTIGVISDWASNLSTDILLPLGLGPYVSFVVVSTILREGKPGNGLYIEALRRADVQASEALHVGDNYVNDVLGARSAGIEAVLLDRTGHHRHSLDCPSIETLLELPALLEDMQHRKP